ncbi:MAG: hypothetical protein ACI9CO_000651 [Candidatus Azotimanducaceae bacterium]|jgi:hypothetical protein
MSIRFKTPLSNRFFLLCGVLLLNACADIAPPFYIIKAKPKAIDVTTVEANITEPKLATTIAYEAEYPETYIVQKGDTLWDISSQFLRDPWYWPEIWFKNPQIKNPHLIYPGDMLNIIYIGGQKRVQLQQRGEDGKILSYGSGMQIIKLSPRVRSKPIDASIPSIPIVSIRHLLSRPIVIDKNVLDNSAYVISSIDNHLANSADDTIYVRKLGASSSNDRYQLFRPNKPLKDPITDELLGYEALYVGETKLLRNGDPATLLITSSVREILPYDRVIPLDHTDFARDFFPKPPVHQVRGKIISLVDAISQLARYQTVSLNLGQRDGIETGNLLRIRHVGSVIQDLEEENSNFRVKLPDEEVGIVMVVRTFEKMSYGLVMEADRPISIKDYVVSP